MKITLLHLSMKESQIRATNLTAKSIAAFDDFAGLVDIRKFNRQLRNLLLYYLSEECEELPYDYGKFIEDMKFLFDFLDISGDEQQAKEASIRS